MLVGMDVGLLKEFVLKLPGAPYEREPLRVLGFTGAFTDTDDRAVGVASKEDNVIPIFGEVAPTATLVLAFYHLKSNSRVWRKLWVFKLDVSVAYEGNLVMRRSMSRKLLSTKRSRRNAS